MRDDIDRLLETARLHPTLPEPRQHLNAALQQAHWDWWYSTPARHRITA